MTSLISTQGLAKTCVNSYGMIHKAALLSENTVRTLLPRNILTMFCYKLTILEQHSAASNILWVGMPIPDICGETHLT